MKTIAIIGGGIAGLYLAHNLAKKKKHCILFEESSRLGGRIYTYKDPYLGKVEAGAGRFLLSHKYLVRLLKDLNLYDKKVRIFGETDYRPSSGSPVFQIEEKNKKTDLIKRVIKASKNLSYNLLRQIIFLDYIKKVLSLEETQLLYDSFGYSTELTTMNAYDAIQLIEKHLSQKYFYVLKDGLSQLVDCIVELLEKSEYVTIRRNCPIKSIHQLASGKYELVSVKCNIETDICICAVPVPILRQWSIFSFMKESLDQIVCAPLCRIYSVVECSVLKFSTNTNIRYYIPMHGNVTMISYTDNDYARRWKKIYDEDGTKVLNRELKEELEKTIGPVSIPKHTKMFYWDYGVGYWTKGADSRGFQLEVKPRLFICGENVSSENQQWIEGALDTAEWVLKNVK
jgi:monoamine oxidase